MFGSRTYRRFIQHPGLTGYQVTVKETDLYVLTAKNYSQEIRDSILKHRGYLETYIKNYPQFAICLSPWDGTGPLPSIVANMVTASQQMSVGPMAAVAGAIADAVGRDMLLTTPQVIIENGGDVFLKTNKPVILGLYAGESPLSMKIGVRVDSTVCAKAVCTSSGTIGHSLSLGKADAVCVVADTGALADAAATALGNQIHSPENVGPVIQSAKDISGIQGVLSIMGETLGVWGDLEVVPLSRSQ